ncbi:hypothetical protein ACJMK2_029043 [Sinanodonta woodiana]|uniref:Ubiquitinyl hydrolase 1 n=1 Tax=Sinanodonta woodiana TaxID=1069815 RepID=A0ABD3XAY1_SINWO
MGRPEFIEKIEDANVNKARTLRQRIERDVGRAQDNKQLPFFLRTFAAFQASLIALYDYPIDFRNYFEEHFLNLDLLQDLERSKVINWCPTVKRLYALKTTGDGNCLLHAVSLTLYAIEDTEQFLRRLIYYTLSTDTTGSFKRRWQFYHRPNQDGGATFRLKTYESSVEWESIVKTAMNMHQQQGEMLPYATLESFHLYVLANILRRPIIVLAHKRDRNKFQQSLQESDFGGIYLPLEIVPAECIKTPVIIGYNKNHFSPLVTQDGDSSSRMNVVPLVTHELEMMVVQYLLPGEEPGTIQILENYLKMTETVLTDVDSIRPILSVRLEKRKVPEDLNLMEDLRQDCETRFKQWLDQEYGSENPNVQLAPAITPKQNIVAQQHLPELHDSNRGPSFVNIKRSVPVVQTPVPPQVNQPVMGQSNRKKCLNPCCMRYGSQETYNLCSKCFKDYTVAYHNQEQEMRRLRSSYGVKHSAPIPSIPLSNSYIDISIVPAKCKTESCDVQCSQTAYPYCFECNDEQLKHKTSQASVHARASMHETAGWLNNEQQEMKHKPHSGIGICQLGITNQQLNTAQTVSVQTIRALPVTSAACQATTMSPNPKRCKALECFNYDLAGDDGLCAACYKNFIFSQGDIPEDKNVHLSTTVGTLNRLRETANKCASPRCENVPITGKTICHQCYGSLKSEGLNISANQSMNRSQYPRLVSPSTVQVAHSNSRNINRCNTKGCISYVVPENNGLCDACYEMYMFGDGNIAENKNLKLFPNAEAFNNLSGPAKRSAGLEGPNIMSLTTMEEKRLHPATCSMLFCAGNNCSKIIYPHKKLCNECDEILEQTHANKSKHSLYQLLYFRLGRQNVTAHIKTSPEHQVRVVVSSYTQPVRQETRKPLLVLDKTQIISFRTKKNSSGTARKGHITWNISPVGAPHPPLSHVCPDTKNLHPILSL